MVTVISTMFFLDAEEGNMLKANFKSRYCIWSGKLCFYQEKNRNRGLKSALSGNHGVESSLLKSFLPVKLAFKQRVKNFVNSEGGDHCLKVDTIHTICQ